MRIAVAGSSGFLGSRLVAKLRTDGHEVVRLVRRPPHDPSEVRWDPAGRALDPAVLSTVDAVVNLAGVNVAGRWTAAHRRRMCDSRVDSTGTLAHALAAADPRPGVLLNASAIGYYGADTGDRPVDEQSPPGEGFLADMCRAWEAATAPAEDAGVRVVHLRTGLPLDPGGGLLKPMLPPFRLGLGGPLGSGRQYWPWISMPDWLGAVRFLLDRTDLAGPVNLTAPQPVTNAEFTRALGAVLHRPAVLPVPAPALRLALGGFASEALGSRRVLPAVLTRSGYAFQHRDVTAALTDALR